MSLTDSRIRLFGVDAEILHGLLHSFDFHLVFTGERAEGSKHDVLGIHFEEIAKCSTVLAASETVRSKRNEAAGNPAGDAFRQHFHVIGCCDKWAGSVLQSLRDEGNPGRLPGMEQIPAFAIVRLTIQLLVAGDAPYVGAHSVFLLQNLLRLEHFEHDGSAAEG